MTTSTAQQRNVTFPEKLIGVDMMPYIRSRDEKKEDQERMRENSEIAMVKRKLFTAFLLTSLIVFLATL